jgi:hypothetical protein
MLDSIATLLLMPLHVSCKQPCLLLYGVTTLISSHLHRQHSNNTVQILDRLLPSRPHHHRRHPLPLPLPSPTRKTPNPRCQAAPAHGNWSSNPPTQPSPPATLIGICLQPNSSHLQTASHEHVPGIKDASCALCIPNFAAVADVFPQREMIHRGKFLPLTY